MHDTHRTHGARLWTRLCFVALTVVFLGSLGTAIVAAQAKPSGKTVWDGVYTDAQAERATATFSSTCSRCHTLGADGNRPLSGDKVWEGYAQKTVADLLAFVSKNMPNGQGGTLSPGLLGEQSRRADPTRRTASQAGTATRSHPRPCAGVRNHNPWKRTARESCLPTRSCVSLAAWLRRAGATGR